MSRPERAIVTVRGAVFGGESDCYRYRLWRHWNVPANGTCCFVMLNPSTADAYQDDPTIRRTIGFAHAWGYGGVEIVNLFARRATDPMRLRDHGDPVGPDNDAQILSSASSAALVVAAWGTHGAYLTRGYHVLLLLKEAGIPVSCLGTTQVGDPRHPLYLPASEIPRPFNCEVV